MQKPVIENTEFRDNSISAAVLRSLQDKKLVESHRVSERLQPIRVNEGLTLNSEQYAALNAVTGTKQGFSCHLLEGVTGSGKTEIYLRLIENCLQQGRQALILVPEIGLTPQTLARFQQRFEANIAVLHSGLSDANRYQAWEAARTGNAHIIVGTRSAVFTPLASPGLIIVDEEHDGSYKQQDGFRYSARDVAVKRAQIHSIPILLGSATPSLESIQNVVAGRYQHQQLTQRVSSGGMPDIKVQDVRRQELHAGLSKGLLEAIQEKLQLGQQTLLFLNRRGYAPTLQCHDCGWIAECRACDARLTIHRRRGRLRCHHCGDSSMLPRQCPQCNSERLMAAGLGTEQTEDFLRTRFKQWPIYRVDSDSMQSKDSMQALAEDINKGEPCILLGTQMLTKGHHFPGVSLVAVIDADALLFSTDFRGEERMAQLLTQVAGRAGRADIPGSVLLQTHYPRPPSAARDVDHQLCRTGQGTTQTATGIRHAPRRATGGVADRLPRCRIRRAVPPNAARTQHAFPLQWRQANWAPAFTHAAPRWQISLSIAAYPAPTRGAAQTAASVLVANAEALPARHGLKWSIDIDPQNVF